MMFEVFGQIDWVALARFSVPVTILFAGAVMIIVGAALTEDRSALLFPLIASAALVLSFASSWYLWPQAGGGVRTCFLTFDRMTLVGWMVIAVAGLFTVLPSVSYRTDAPKAEYYGLVLTSAFGMGILISAAELVTILIALEVMSLSVYALVGYSRGHTAPLEAAFKYFLVGIFASAFYVMGLAFMFGSSGSTELAVIADRAGDVAASGWTKSFFLFGTAMLLVGFAFKLGAVPFHTWVPDAYEGAPTPVTSFMATGVKTAASLAFLRFIVAVAGGGGALLHDALWVVAFVTMLTGNLAALRQDNLKRMLAYSSIAHAGFILVVFPSIAVEQSVATRAVLFYLVAYVAMMGGAFAVVAALEEGGGGSGIGSLAGIARGRPFLAAVFSLFLISLAGFPPTIGFLGKYYLFAAAMKGGELWLVVAALLNSVIAAYYYLRPVVAMYFRERRLVTLCAGEMKMPSEAGLPVVSPAVLSVVVFAALAVVIFGVLPNNILYLIQASVP